MDQIVIGTKGSITDFDAHVSLRKISKPKKKSIRETVPFSNRVYDFSGIAGEIYWEERELEYELEITADTPEELEEKKARISSWLMNIESEILFDPYIKGYHFVVTYDDMDIDDEEDVEKTTITVKFVAYPYMIADSARTETYVLSAGVKTDISVVNNASHRITPSIECDAGLTITIGNASYSIQKGLTKSDKIKLEKGMNTWEMQMETDGNATITFVEEVL